MLSTLFKSAHFYDPLNMGCIIKSPLDHAVGVSRLFSMAFPGSSDVVNQYRMWTYLTGKAATAQQDIGDPPNVAGWQAYYQSPQFYELWINSDTLPKRTVFTDTLVRTGYTAGGFRLFIDTVLFAGSLTNPSDPNDLVEESAQYLFANPITATQKTFLKQILIPGLPDYEWTDEWAKYVADPTNATKLSAVRSKLQALYAFMLSMPEFQLL